MPTTSALPKRLVAAAAVFVLTVSMAANAMADPIDLARTIEFNTGLATFQHPDLSDVDSVVKRHYLIHASELRLQASAMVDLEHYLASAEPDHGKWVRISAAEITSTGLLDVAGADYALVKHAGPNLNIFVFSLGSEASTGSAISRGPSTIGVRSDNDADDDDQDDDDYVGVAGVGSGSSGSNGSSGGNGLLGRGIIVADVPDGGSTAILLGLSLFALGVLRRKSSNS